MASRSCTIPIAMCRIPLMSYIFRDWYFWSELFNETIICKYPVLVIDENFNASFIQLNADLKCTIMDEATVVGFEVPKSPDSSYNNVYPGNEDEARDPPMVPSHLQHTLLNYPANRDTAGTLPLPQNVILNHLYIENRESPRSVVALGFTHRFRSKYVTVVLYKPVQRRGNTSI
ncbi:SNF1-related protein kinase regulatory subunit beta-3 [Spatholobus suberectus]|nr:SNF1-related protein kinase regulatory subunit beta-3 [Spatholobus suberectus]